MAIGEKLLNAGIGAAGSVIGMIGQNQRAKKQHNRQKELMDIQNKNQQSLNKQGHELQMDMWNKTNYGAQMEHMKSAGLNPGLMYGQSGAGGATTGSQGGGSAASGSAAAPMDIGNAVQAGLMMAQTEKLNAETKEIEEKSSKTNQEGKAQFIENVINEYKMRLTGGDSDITTSKKYGSAQIDKGSPIARLILKEPEKLEQEIENLGLEEIAKSAGIELTEEKTRALYHEIIRKWAETGIKAINPGQLIKMIKGTN